MSYEEKVKIRKHGRRKNIKRAQTQNIFRNILSKRVASSFVANIKASAGKAVVDSIFWGLLGKWKKKDSTLWK